MPIAPPPPCPTRPPGRRTAPAAVARSTPRVTPPATRHQHPPAASGPLHQPPRPPRLRRGMPVPPPVYDAVRRPRPATDPAPSPGVPRTDPSTRSAATDPAGRSPPPAPPAAASAPQPDPPPTPPAIPPSQTPIPDRPPITPPPSAGCHPMPAASPRRNATPDRNPTPGSAPHGQRLPASRPPILPSSHPVPYTRQRNADPARCDPRHAPHQYPTTTNSHQLPPDRPADNPSYRQALEAREPVCRPPVAATRIATPMNEHGRGRTTMDEAYEASARSGPPRTPAEDPDPTTDWMVPHR